MGANFLVKLALGGVARNDNAVTAVVGEQMCRVVETQVGHPLLFIRAVTGKAAVRQDRTNVAVKVHRPDIGLSGRDGNDSSRVKEPNCGDCYDECGK